MRPAEYPQRKCREAVFGLHQAYNCELPNMHVGPCASQSVLISIAARNAWEAANPDAADAQHPSHDVVVDSKGNPQ